MMSQNSRDNIKAGNQNLKLRHLCVKIKCIGVFLCPPVNGKVMDHSLQYQMFFVSRFFLSTVYRFSIISTNKQEIRLKCRIIEKGMIKFCSSVYLGEISE